MPKNKKNKVYKCRCSECKDDPCGETALLHTSVNQLVFGLDEKHRRLFVGLLASQFGHGGIQYYAKVTGLHRNTISCGKQEIKRANPASGEGIRSSGGGRHKAEKKNRI